MNDKIQVYCNDVTGSGGGGPDWWTAKFLEGAQWDLGGFTKHGIGIIVNGGRSDRRFCTSDWESALLTNGYGIREYRSDFNNEKRKARQARFEYGETPQT